MLEVSWRSEKIIFLTFCKDLVTFVKRLFCFVNDAVDFLLIRQNEDLQEPIVYQVRATILAWNHEPQKKNALEIDKIWWKSNNKDLELSKVNLRF